MPPQKKLSMIPFVRLGLFLEKLEVVLHARFYSPFFFILSCTNCQVKHNFFFAQKPGGQKKTVKKGLPKGGKIYTACLPDQNNNDNDGDDDGKRYEWMVMAKFNVRLSFSSAAICCPTEKKHFLPKSHILAILSFFSSSFQPNVEKRVNGMSN